MSTIETQTAKDRMIAVLQNLPDDSSMDELLSELLLERSIARGIADYLAGRVKTHEEVGAWIEKRCQS